MDDIDEEEPTDFSGVEGGMEVAVSPSPSPTRSPPLKKANKTATSPPLRNTSIKDRDFASVRASRGDIPTRREMWLSKPTSPATSPPPPTSGRRPGTQQ